LPKVPESRLTQIFLGEVLTFSEPRKAEEFQNLCAWGVPKK